MDTLDLEPVQERGERVNFNIIFFINFIIIIIVNFIDIFNFSLMFLSSTSSTLLS